MEGGVRNSAEEVHLPSYILSLPDDAPHRVEVENEAAGFDEIRKKLHLFRAVQH